MAKYQEGEHISLWFEDYDHKEYVKGWVSLDQAQQAIKAAFDNDKEALEVMHTYAFWGVAVDECGEPCNRLYLREQPGRGRFKVTEVSVREAA